MPKGLSIHLVYTAPDGLLANATRCIILDNGPLRLTL